MMTLADASVLLDAATANNDQARADWVKATNRVGDAYAELERAKVAAAGATERYNQACDELQAAIKQSQDAAARNERK